MISDLNQYYESQDPEIRDCLNALRHVVLNSNPEISEAWKYKMPFFCYKGKMFCYLWFHKKIQQPYIGFVDGKFLEHEQLIQEKRSRMKILLVDTNTDIPIHFIKELIAKAIALKSNI